MKILCLSDLHRYSNINLQQNNWIKELLQEYNPDVVVITGDVFESCYQGNPYKGLYNLFGDVLVLCVLGNHEFMNKTVKDVLQFYKGKYQPKRYNVHYLDIIGHYDFKKIRFLGNVLWYDGSMSTVKNQDISTFADGNWIDKTIINFDYMKEHEKCIDQIINNIGNYIEVDYNILCTHCVPHYKLNGHMNKIESQFNAYSGSFNLLDRLNNIDYSISGHTHWRTIGKEINNCFCINTGNDYSPPFSYYLLEINDY